jgi:UDPglucose--hexose-1-phosphate uridylyltransferase
MCPGNRRANGSLNPSYSSTFVFDNDFPALSPDTEEAGFSHEQLLIASGAPGLCRVVCFSPRHDLTLAMMHVKDVRRVVDVWIEQLEEIGISRRIRYVQIFENRGAMMGASNPHPHCQIWATHHLPNEVGTEDTHLRRHFEASGSDLLGDYCRLERSLEERLVCANDDFLALVPFWAVWPFETLIVSTAQFTGLTALSPRERNSLADILKRLLTRYDNLFEAPCPYSMGVHSRPEGAEDSRHWRLHLHVYPPLLRSASVRKFMVGYELLGTPQRDLTPELAAEKLRSASERHSQQHEG